MNWAAISTVFLLSTVKFLFAPFTGIGFSLNLFETAIASFAGAVISASVFYFSSKFFIARQRKKILKNGGFQFNTSAARRKRRVNRVIVKLKWKLGQYGICFLGPLFLSVPVGSIICAKFYNHSNKTFPLIILCLAINSFILSSLAHLIIN